MHQPWIKVCGMTRIEDIRQAFGLGARYVGCIVGVSRSPRSIPIESAADLSEQCPGPLVAVTQDMPLAELRRMLEQCRPDCLQLHGSEGPELVEEVAAEFGHISIWKALALESAVEHPTDRLEQVLEATDRYQGAGAEAIVLDARYGGEFGGTGKTCDWELAADIVQAATLPIILAGGLGPENVRQAAEAVRPAGLDVSSGVEETPGIKSRDQVEALFRAWGGDRPHSPPGPP